MLTPLLILVKNSIFLNSGISQRQPTPSYASTFLKWNTYRGSRKSREASLSTLTRQTYNTTRSSQTLRT